VIRAAYSFILVAACLGATQVNASISTSIIDFSGIAPGLQGSTLNLVEDGVAVTFFSPANLRISDITFLGTTYRVLHADNFQDPITVTFGGGFTAAFVEIENPLSFGDIVTGEAFDASNVSLDSGSTTLLDGVLRLDGPGIAQVVYDDVNTGYVLDSFAFSAIPEPSSFLVASLLLASFGVSPLARRSLRRRML